MSFDGSNGPVTQNEINSFISFLGQPSRIPKTALRNRIADRNGGQDVEALGLMYEVTQNPQILDIMINYSDTFLSLRNNPENGRILWTGKRELVWCTKPENGSGAGYAGAEGLDTVGHIAYTAYHILKTPCLWHENVTDKDPFKYGVTYLDRAHKYVTEMDKTIDTYYLKYFIHENDSRIYNPNYTAWETVDDLPPNSAMPWNRQQMMTNGFLRMAECHEIIGDNETRVNKYFNIIQVSINWMISEFRPVKSKNDKDAYFWSYSEGLKSPERIGIHALYDIWGIYRAWQRKDKLNINSDVMVKLANTMMYIINIGDYKISKFIDGTSPNNDAAGTLYGPWAFYAEFIPDWYEFFVNLNINRIKSGPEYMGALLWVKNARASGTFPNSTQNDFGTTSTSSQTCTLPSYELVSLILVFNFVFYASL
ncbi:44486_t:CDS:1 [Gigaspora margarita]|uniref:44486_t:CDS:1 n=1 Tax=Gigaspora margarita TaxID=4874 RepID=A0ABM8W1A6_GIGMA|nr:44486_t:CDS:1 [Gigaspora margarita]